MVPVDRELDPLSDDALMVLFAKGEAAAARVLTARLLPRILRHAAHVLGNRSEAEDVAQEVMLRLWRAAADWQPDGPARPATWAYRVTANLAIDRIRARRGSVPLETVPEPPDAAPGPGAVMDAATRAAALERALQSLPERQRQAVVLRHLEGLSNPQIAEVLDISVEAVESLTARGKRALSAALKGQKEALGYDG